MKKTTITLAILTLVSACTNTRMTSIQNSVQQEAKSEVQAVFAQNKNKLATTIVDGQYIAADYENYVNPTKGVVNTNLNGSTISAALQNVAQMGGFTTVVASDVVQSGVLKNPIAIDIRNQSVEDALREIASSAGLVAIIDQRSKKVTIGFYGTYTYRVPPSIFRAQSSETSLSASPSSNGSSKGSSSEQNSSASFSVNKSTKEATKNIKSAIIAMAGGGSEVQIDEETGLISVRAEAQQLKRITAYLDSLARDALMQVELQTTLVKIDVRDNIDVGVDWNKIVEGANQIAASSNAAKGLANSVFNLNFARANSNITASIKALAEFGRVTVLDQSTNIYKNHTSGVFSNGTMKPFVPKTESTVSGSSGSVSNSLEVESALDGISLGVTPHIVNSNFVDLQLVPMINQLGQLRVFTSGNSSASMYESKSTNMNSNLVAKNGQTVVAARISNKKKAQSDTGLPFLNRTPLNALAGRTGSDLSRSEILMLVYVRIIDAPNVKTLVGESL